MRGSVTLNTPRYLPALVGSHVQGLSLLASLSGKTVLTAADPDCAPEQAGATRPDTPAGMESQVKQDIAHFAKALAAADTPAQLLAYPVALRVLLTAHGLADQADNSALAMRALLSNPARSNSLLNQLKDPRWLAVNYLYSFATEGLAVLRNPETVAAISLSYGEALRAAWLRKSSPTASNAATFPPTATQAETL